MYKINQVASLAGISTRTLRYYDEIGLLAPSTINESGYRLYDDAKIDILQSILFYKELGFDLTDINKIINNNNYDMISSLKSHLIALEKKKNGINRLIKLVKNTIESKERNIIMKNEDKFTAFKENLIEENETKYGKEIREKYGEDAINQSYDKMRKMSKWQMNEAKRLSDEIDKQLVIAFNTNNPSSDESTKLCELHEQWIKMYWVSYSKDAHLGLSKMYTEDDRFKAYYDKRIKGGADFLYTALKHYLNEKE